MQEQLISFEVAKLAKEKGFDVSVNTYYDLSNVFTKDKQSLSEYTVSLDYNSKTKYPQFKEKCYISRPTQTLLQKWLREVHNCHVEVAFHSFINDNFEPEKDSFKTPNDFKYTVEVNYYGKNMEIPQSEEDFLGYNFDTYEEALELGLFKALELI